MSWPRCDGSICTRYPTELGPSLARGSVNANDMALNLVIVNQNPDVLIAYAFDIDLAKSVSIEYKWAESALSAKRRREEAGHAD